MSVTTMIGSARLNNDMDHRTEMIIRAVATSVAILGFMILTYKIVENNAEPTEKFKVVDKYKNCDVVRYTDRSNQLHHFLHCNP
jgi:hypothetical protein